MKIALCLALLAACSAGFFPSCHSQDPASQKVLNEQVASYRNLPAIFGLCKKADHVEIFEGLPAMVGKEVLEAEEKRSDTFKRDIFRFYSPALTLPEKDQKVLLEETLIESSYVPWQGLKLCRFHPDLLIRFTHDEAVVDLLLCFGCSEAYFLAPKISAHVGINGLVAAKWEEIQKRNRTKAPKPFLDEIKEK